LLSEGASCIGKRVVEPAVLRATWEFQQEQEKQIINLTLSFSA